MSITADDNIAFAARAVDSGVQTVALSRGYHATTVMLRVFSLIVVPVAFWSAIFAIIF